MNTRTILSFFLLTMASGQLALAAPNSRIFKGKAPILSPTAIAEMPSLQDEYSRHQIGLVLEAESHMTSVADAMSVKQTGLGYVQDISDFEYLSNYAVSNPSVAYQNALGEFIATYAGNYVRKPDDLRYVRTLEGRTTTVDRAIRTKTAGLKAVRTIQDFLNLVPVTLSNPSLAYVNAVSSFVAANVKSAVNEFTPVYLIVSAETYTKFVADAMAVKNAGLVAVHSKRDLLELAQFSVSNPSDGYRNAVNAFIRDNIGRYP